MHGIQGSQGTASEGFRAKTPCRPALQAGLWSVLRSTSGVG